MGCGFTEDSYGAHVLGLLDDEERSLIDEHVERNCETCVEGLRSARFLWFAVGSSSPDVNLPPGLRRRVLANFQPAVPWWRRPLPLFAGAVALASVAFVSWFVGVRHQPLPERPVPEPPVIVTRNRPPQVIQVPVPSTAAPPAAPPALPATGVPATGVPAKGAPAPFAPPGQLALIAKLQEDLSQQSRRAEQLESQLAEQKSLLETAQTQRRNTEAELQAVAGSSQKAQDLAKRVASLTERTTELERQVTQYRTLLEVERKRSQQPLQLAAMVADPGFRVVYLKGSEVSPTAEGHAIIARNQMAFFASRLPALPAGRTYQLWALRGTGQGVMSAGVFHPEAGKIALQITDPQVLEGMKALAVTDEPEQGSALPTGHKWIVGF